MPPGVRFLPSPGAAQEPNYNVNAVVDFLMPLTPAPAILKLPFWNVMGRLKPGITPERGQAELQLIAAAQARTDRDFEGIAPRLVPFIAEMNRDGRRILLPLFGAAALVLLIACGNTAALLLVRGLQRQQEYAMRRALGVGRLALFRQVVGREPVAGGPRRRMRRRPGVWNHQGLQADWRTGDSAAGCRHRRLARAGGWSRAPPDSRRRWPGLIPAVRATRLDPMAVLKSAGPTSSAGRRERRLLRAVTMVQTALTLALLVGAGLLIRTMSNLASVSSGYRTEHVLTMTVTAVQGDWSDFHVRALERVSSVPGVQQAAFAWGVPLTGNNWPGVVEIEGRPVANPADRIAVPLRSVTPGYFSIVGLAIADGRDFRSSDTRTAPGVAIVNQSLVDRYFGGSNPIGRKIWMRGRQQPPNEVVGVVTNGRTDDLTRAAEPEIYLSLWQATAFSKDLVVRAAGDPRSVASSVQRELRTVDPTVAVENVRTLEQIRGDSVASRTFATQLLIGFALVASLLTLVGIYGVLSLSVAARRREIAIRAAVGARQQDIRNLVFAEGLRLVAGGVLSGIVAAAVLSRVLTSFLFGVEPTDPATLTGVGLLFTAVALLACWVPTRRAAQVDPLEALRSE